MGARASRGKGLKRARVDQLAARLMIAAGVVRPAEGFLNHIDWFRHESDDAKQFYRKMARAAIAALEREGL